MAQLMPLPLIVSCFSKIQIGLTFLVPAHPGSPGKRAVKWVCVCFQSSNEIDDYRLVFIVSISLLCKILNTCQNEIHGIVTYTFLNLCEEFTSFCQVLKKMHKKLVPFFCLTVYLQVQKSEPKLSLNFSFFLKFFLSPYRRLRNDLYHVKWGVTLLQPTITISSSFLKFLHFISLVLKTIL